MNIAKEKAKEKKHKKEFKKYKKVYDEKMIRSSDVTDGSDTSLASNNNSILSASDRVKKWLQKIPNEAALTKREQELQKRRKRAEKLLKWKRRLDEQEKSIIRIEEAAGQINFHVRIFTNLNYLKTNLRPKAKFQLTKSKLNLCKRASQRMKILRNILLTGLFLFQIKY